MLTINKCAHMLQLQKNNRRNKTSPRYATSRFCSCGTFYDSSSHTWLYAKGRKKLSIKMNGGGLTGIILVNPNAKGEVRGYVSFPMYMQGCFARFPLYQVKTVRVLPFIYCIQNKSPLCCCRCTSKSGLYDSNCW